MSDSEGNKNEETRNLIHKLPTLNAVADSGRRKLYKRPIKKAQDVKRINFHIFGRKVIKCPDNTSKMFYHILKVLNFTQEFNNRNLVYQYLKAGLSYITISMIKW